MKTTSFKTLIIFLISVFFSNISFSEELKNVEVIGNDRIAKETIMVFGDIKKGTSITAEETNKIIKKLYATNFFSKVEINFDKGILVVKVEENPFINLVIFNGVKAKKFKEGISEIINLKEKTSYQKNKVVKDVSIIKRFYRELGYFFANVEAEIQPLSNNRVNLIYNIDQGKKATIKKIFFTGDKKIRDLRLLNVITSEEDKFWKFISRAKYLNAERIELDKRLLKNFYLHKGFYEVDVSSTNVEYTESEDEGFVLTYNINAGKRYKFKKISLDVESGLEESAFYELKDDLEEIVGHYYSPIKLRKILNKIDNLSEKKELQFINHRINERLEDDNIVVKIDIFEGEKYFVERINIIGNNVTRDAVIRSKMLIDEGDPYSELLLSKSINNIKATQIFANVDKKVLPGTSKDFNIIEIEIEEKATGEISAGAGFGTEGGTFQFGVRENNFLGTGVKLEASLDVTEESLRGRFSADNPNYQFSGNALRTTIESSKLDRLSDSGYESTVTGFSIGTTFEQYENIFLAPNLSLYYEDIDTNDAASSALKKMEGAYTDFIFGYSIFTDKRNQKFRPTEGYLTSFRQRIPLYADKPSLLNGLDFTSYHSMSDNLIGSFKFYSRAINSVGDDDVKISQRLHLPSKRLRGFQRNKIGPVDSDDHVGGNYATAFGFNASLPNLLPEDLRTDFHLFIDAGNVWAVDYNDTVGDSNKLRSSFGLSANIFTPVGPLNFTFAQDLSKADTDKTETFRFNLGTTF